MSKNGGLNLKLSLRVHHNVSVSILFYIVGINANLVQKPAVVYVLFGLWNVFSWLICEGIKMANKAHRDGYASIWMLQNLKVSIRKSSTSSEFVVEVTQTRFLAHHMRNSDIKFDVFWLRYYFSANIASQQATNRCSLATSFCLG